MRGLLASLIRQGVGGDEDDIEVSYRPRKQFTRADIERIAARGAEQFRDRAMNLISCFGPLEGEFGLYSSLSNFIQTKGALTAEINEAVQDGDEVDLVQAFTRAMEFAFVTLYEKKRALARLQLVENLPAEAMVEYVRMRQSVANFINPVVAAPVVTKAPVAPVVVETPVEICVREFKELPSQAWKIKWLTNMKNRPIADQAFAEGRI
jgi:hypothetical protein